MHCQFVEQFQVLHLTLCIRYYARNVISFSASLSAAMMPKMSVND